MPFSYPETPHARLHGPAGYSTYESYRDWLRDEFLFRCVFCLKREQWGVVRASFHLDHFLPQALRPDVELEYDNLLYAYASCNSAKGAEIVPDPCECMLAGNVAVWEDGRIEARTDDAERLIRILGLDDAEYREFRRLLIGIVELAQDTELFQQIMKYPESLPDLSLKSKRLASNSRPEGVDNSCFARQKRGDLPATY